MIIIIMMMEAIMVTMMVAMMIMIMMMMEAIMVAMMIIIIMMMEVMTTIMIEEIVSNIKSTVYERVQLRSIFSASFLHLQKILSMIPVLVIYTVDILYTSQMFIDIVCYL